MPSYPTYEREIVVIDGQRYELIRDTTWCTGAILRGEAALIDVGEDLLVYAFPLDKDV